jgi:hypothetical protein
MAGTIKKKVKNKKVYYYYHETYREKIDKKASGKIKGTGKSKVVTITKYLGTAKDIFKKYNNFQEPVSVIHKSFGVIAAAYETALDIGLIDLLKKYIKGKRFDIERWLFFFIPIINRLDHSTSKNKMTKWLKNSILPDILHFDPEKFTSKNFWYVTDDIIPEKEIRENASDDIFKGVDIEIFNNIEEELYQSISKKFNLSENLFFYDTTNFFTYIQEPSASNLAQTGHNKDSKHHLKQIGLLMAVERNFGIPILHKIYTGNKHDSKTFNSVLSELIVKLKKCCKENTKIILVLDKGNNSEENFARLKKKIFWIGSLAPYQYEELIKISLSKYDTWEDMKFFRCKKEIMGNECTVIVTFCKRNREDKK